MDQIRQQRVRGLDRVLQGRLDGRPVETFMRKQENTRRRHRLFELA